MYGSRLWSRRLERTGLSAPEPHPRILHGRFPTRKSQLCFEGAHTDLWKDRGQGLGGKVLQGVQNAIAWTEILWESPADSCKAPQREQLSEHDHANKETTAQTTNNQHTNTLKQLSEHDHISSISLGIYISITYIYIYIYIYMI